jgi:hypothetical protein
MYGLSLNDFSHFKMKGVLTMKKTILYTIAMVFVVSLGAAYAGNNGVTDFTGRNIDSIEMAPVAAANSVESVSAGGLRADEKPLYNGVTDFTGKSYEDFEIAPVAGGKIVESESAGGLRKGQEPDKASHEGLGPGRTYDTIPMNPALGW